MIPNPTEAFLNIKIELLQFKPDNVGIKNTNRFSGSIKILEFSLMLQQRHTFYKQNVAMLTICFDIVEV